MQTGNGHTMTFEDGAFVGNSSGRGGAIRMALELFTPGSSGFGPPPQATLNRCSFQGNYSSGSHSIAEGPADYTDCILWDTRFTASPYSSDPTQAFSVGGIFGPTGIGGTSSFTGTLIEGLDLTDEVIYNATNCFDGTNPANEPRFYAPVLVQRPNGPNSSQES